MEGECCRYKGNDMAASQTNEVIRHLRRAVLLPDGAGLTDEQLLRDYISRRDEAAFAVLVRRHAPMVWGVCRRVLGNHHDAEDAFQAAFLVLVRKAGSIASPELLANWLYGVAHLTALKVMATTGKRRLRERQVTEMPEPAATEPDVWHKLQPLLDQELSRLPEKHRVAIVLCELEGKTRKEAARQVGVPEGTLAARLARGRAMLAKRLARHGLAVSGGAIAAVLAQNAASASAPSSVVSGTIHATGLFGAGQAAACGLISPTVAALVEGVLKTMLLTKLKIATAVLLATGLLIAGLSALAYPALAQIAAEGQKNKQPEKESAEKQDGANVWKSGADDVRSLAYCNGGKTLAVVLWKGSPNDRVDCSSVVLWDVRTGKVERTLVNFGEGDLQFRHVTASKDGSIIAALGDTGPWRFQGEIKVWEAKTGKLVRSFTLDMRPSGAVALSPDGKTAAGAGVRFGARDRGSVKVWDVSSGELIQALPTSAEATTYNSIAFLGDGKWIAAAGSCWDGGKHPEAGKVVVWDVETGKVKQELTEPDMGDAQLVALSLDGKQVAAGGGRRETTVRVWDTQTGKLNHRLNALDDVLDYLEGLAFSPDGKTLATAGSKDGKVLLWDTATGEARETLEGHSKRVWCVAFSPDDRVLASGGSDGTMRFWPVASAKRPGK
jgi:RNA polymerase sigma factor (sigma-70 family)